MKNKLTLTINDKDKERLQEIAFLALGTTNISKLLRHIANNAEFADSNVLVVKKGR